MSSPDASKVIPIVPAATGNDDDNVVSLYAAAKKVYPRSVQGVFARWRWAMVFLTQLVFYGLPWLQWGQRQAVLFDLDGTLMKHFKMKTGDREKISGLEKGKYVYSVFSGDEEAEDVRNGADQETEHGAQNKASQKNRNVHRKKDIAGLCSSR